MLAKLKLLHEIFRPDPDELGDEYHSGHVGPPRPLPKREREYE